MRQLILADSLFAASDQYPDLIEDAGVIVDSSGRIEAVGSAKDLQHKSLVEHRFRGVLMPGLCDVHTHLCFSAGLDPFADALREHPARMTLRAVNSLGAHLDAGVTTIRDVGGLHGIDLQMQHLVDEGQVEGPAVYAAGQLIAMTGGHACMMGIEADGADAVRAAARKNLKNGSRLIKLIATGGVLTSGVRPGAQQLSEEEMRAAVEEATKVGKRVAAHAQGSEGIDAALRAGVHTIEHGFWLSDYALEVLAQPGKALVPTLAALICMRRMGDVLPAEILQKLDEAAIPHRQSIRRAHAAGCSIAVGTDAGTPGNPHGNIGVELAGLHDHGLSAMDCWRSATRCGAEALGVDDRGQLDVGRRADMIVVNRNDFDQVSENFRPIMVMRGGARLRG